MKWFFALNSGSATLPDYVALLKVAVHTALKYTSLEPHFIYDGEPCELTAWMEERKCRVIYCRSFLYNRLQRLADKKGQKHIFDIGSGAFLRLEIPRIARQFGIHDEHVLYTDCDVMFRADVVPQMSGLKPAFFAVAPEVDVKNLTVINTGVMVMNLRKLRQIDFLFKFFTEVTLPKLVSKAWDQTAYQQFFKGVRPQAPLWSQLDPLYNYRPYWGEIEGSYILHFHGPKPHQRAALASDNVPVHLRPLLPYVGPDYERACAEWEAEWEECRRE